MAIHSSQLDPLRRQLRAELTELSDVITSTQSQDALSKDCALWCGYFFQALNLERVPAQELVDRFAPALQDLLVEGFSDAVDGEGRFIHFPLGTEACIGSDGLSYNPALLQLRLSDRAEPYRHRSLARPDDPSPFVTKPHLLARKCGQWLERHGLNRELPEEVVRLYEQRLKEKTLVPIPTEKTERARQIIEERKRKDAEKEREMLAKLQEHQGSLDAMKAHFTTTLREKVAGPFSQRIETLQKRSDALFSQAEKEERSQAALLSTALDASLAELFQIEEENGELTTSVSQAEADTMSVERQGQKLDRFISEVEERIRRQETRAFLWRVGTVAIVGTAAIALCGINCAMGGSALRFRVAPMINGGAQCSFTLPLGDPAPSGQQGRGSSAESLSFLFGREHRVASAVQSKGDWGTSARVRPQQATRHHIYKAEDYLRLFQEQPSGEGSYFEKLSQMRRSSTVGVQEMQTFLLGSLPAPQASMKDPSATGAKEVIIEHAEAFCAGVTDGLGSLGKHPVQELVIRPLADTVLAVAQKVATQPLALFAGIGAGDQRPEVPQSRPLTSKDVARVTGLVVANAAVWGLAYKSVRIPKSLRRPPNEPSPLSSGPFRIHRFQIHQTEEVEKIATFWSDRAYSLLFRNPHKIRPGQESHVHVINLLCEELPIDIGLARMPKGPELLRYLDPNYFFFVASTSEGRPMGLMSAYCCRGETLQLEILVTNPDNFVVGKEKVKGVGSCLLKAAERFSVARGNGTVELAAFSGARGFYLGRGYHAIDPGEVSLFRKVCQSKTLLPK